MLVVHDEFLNFRSSFYSYPVPNTVDCRILDTTGPCMAVHTAARQAKILVEIPKEI